MDDAGVDRFPLLGIWQGAAVAIAYAAAHPDRVTHLVLYGSSVQGLLAGSSSDRRREEAKVMIDLARVGWGRDNAAFLSARPDDAAQSRGRRRAGSTRRSAVGRRAARRAIPSPSALEADTSASASRRGEIPQRVSSSPQPLAGTAAWYRTQQSRWSVLQAGGQALGGLDVLLDHLAARPGAAGLTWFIEPTTWPTK